MRKKGAYLILSLAAALFMLFCFSASAQDVDIDNMTNEQLTQLLQAIMQKLETNNAASPAEVPSVTVQENTESVPTPETAETSGQSTEKRQFQIYENKKLVIGRMPDSYFIRINEGDGSENNGNIDCGYGWEDDDGGYGFISWGDIVIPPGQNLWGTNSPNG